MPAPLYHSGKLIFIIPPFTGKYLVGLKVMVRLPSTVATVLPATPGGGIIVEVGLLNVDSSGRANSFPSLSEV